MDETRAELNAGKLQLDKGWDDYYDGLAEYEDEQFFGTVQLLQCFGRRRAGCGQLLHGHSKLFGLVGQRLETGLIGGFALRQLLQAIL